MLPMIRNLIDSLNKQTADVAVNKPFTLVTVNLPAPTAKDPAATTLQTLYVPGKFQEVKDLVTAWMRGNADLIGYTSRYDGEEIALSHRIGSEATAHVF